MASLIRDRRPGTIRWPRGAARADVMAALDGAALDRLVPLPWGGQMTLGGFLERYPMELLVHTWDLAQVTRQVAVLDPGKDL